MSSSSCSTIFRFDLTVPFREKETVKRLGANWDPSKKAWYYNGDLPSVQQKLMEWDPRIYLDVPYEEKNEARDQYGCNWDPKRKKWYLHADNMFDYDDWDEVLERWRPMSSVPSISIFQTGQKVELHSLQEDIYLNGTQGRLMSYDDETDRWTLVLLHNGHSVTVLSNNLVGISESFAKSQTTSMNKTIQNRKKPPRAATAPQSSCSSSSSAFARAGNSKEATLLRISDYMTVPQLQEECRFRGTIRGFSNKNKAWLLDQLVVGSVWQSAASTQHSTTITTTTTTTAVGRSLKSSGTGVSKQKKKRSSSDIASQIDSRSRKKSNTKKKREPELGDLSGSHDSPYLYDQLGFYEYHMEMNRRYEEEEGDY